MYHLEGKVAANSSRLPHRSCLFRPFTSATRRSCVPLVTGSLYGRSKASNAIEVIREISEVCIVKLMKCGETEQEKQLFPGFVRATIEITPEWSVICSLIIYYFAQSQLCN